MGFMAGLVAAAVPVGVGFLVGWAIRVAGKGTHTVFGVVGAMFAVGGCAMGNLLAVIVIVARAIRSAAAGVFTRLTPDVVYSLACFIHERTRA